MQKYPDKTVTGNYLGNFYKSIRQYDSAFHYYKLAIQYDTDDPIPYINIAKTYTELKQRDSAIALLYHWRQLHQMVRPCPIPNWGIYKEAKQLDSAAVYFTKASDLQPDFTPAIKQPGPHLPGAAKVRFGTTLFPAGHCIMIRTMPFYITMRAWLLKKRSR